MAARITRYYDETMYQEKLYEYFGCSDFFNYGYWDENTLDQKTACENLVEKLLSFIPAKSGNILDVACGKGETALFLSKYFEPQNIMGINLSEKQLETCRRKVPGANFAQMDAAALQFADNSYDTIMCLEAVFHFHTREKFLKEAYRVLKPQGYLVLTDVLLTEWGKKHKLWWIDAANAGVSDLQEYTELYQRLGFLGIQVIDATKECWQGYYTNLARYCCGKLDEREFEVTVFNKIAVNIFRKIPATRYYLLVAARKA
jgi:ubiquinone/menaquinone biosynthesis C-methylase UbiE